MAELAGTKLYMLDETSPFMMSFVLITQKNNCIIIDGGRAEDMPKLKEYVGARHVSAWILTHPHNDHIDGFLHEMRKNGGTDFDIEAVYCRFPDYKALSELTENDVPDLEYFKTELEECMPAYLELLPRFEEKLHTVQTGEELVVDELRIEFLYTLHDGLYANLMNDASLVFKVYGPHKTMLFLGDLGPDGGDLLLREAWDKLKADCVQMAHHGHMNVSMEVYARIAPEACFWCAPRWLYEEPAFPPYLADTAKLRRMQRVRMYGTGMTRRWMEQLGVKKHYVTADGVHCVSL